MQMTCVWYRNRSLTALLDLSCSSEEKTRKRGDEHRKHWIWPKKKKSTELNSEY